MSNKIELPDDIEDEDEVEPYVPTTIDGIRFIEINGTIGKRLGIIETQCGGFDLDFLNNQIELAAMDETVDTVLFVFDSPGGVSTGVYETGELLKELGNKKRTVAYTDTMCCSAAYWLASQCNEVYCSPSSTVGSIGVYTVTLDETRAMEMEGIAVNVFKAGKYKVSGASFQKMNDEEKAMFQKDVDNLYNQFKSAVRNKRDIKDEDMEGLTFDGDMAVEKGYADGLLNTASEALRFLQLNG